MLLAWALPPPLRQAQGEGGGRASGAFFKAAISRLFGALFLVLVWQEGRGAIYFSENYLKMAPAGGSFLSKRAKLPVMDNGSPASEEAASSDSLPITPRERLAVLVASILGSSMAFINGTSVTLALDAIQADLGASLSQMLWVASVYMLFLAALMLIGGALGDFYGRRATFSWGVGIFTLASLGCALAPSPDMLILARAGQGIGAALLTPMSLTLIADVFPKGPRSMAIGIWSAASAVMTAIGPPLGGWLASEISWRWIFIIAIPIGILTLIISLVFTPSRPPKRKPEKIDWQGAVLAFVGCSGLAFGLIALARADGAGLYEWFLPFMVGVIAIGLLIRVERRATSPMAPPELFKSGLFNSVNFITILLYGAMSGIFVFYPIYLKEVHHLPLMQAGLAFLGFTLPMGILTLGSGFLMKRFGVRLLLAFGSTITILAFAAMGLFDWSGTMWGAFIAMMIFGTGMAFVVPSMTTVIFNATPEESHGAASGVNNALARAASLFAIAGYGAIAAAAFAANAGAEARFVGFGMGEALSGEIGENYRNAMNIAFNMLIYVSMGLALSAVVVALFFIDKTAERTSVKISAKHQIFGFLRMFSTAPTREKDITQGHEVLSDNQQAGSEKE